MPVTGRNEVKEVKEDAELLGLLEKASKTYSENFKDEAWLGRCIFLSWYCSLGNCDFCYRSTQKHKIKHAASARRRKESIYTEAFIIKNFKWRLEFLTGGYGIYPYEDLLEITKNVSDILDEKIWLNMGVLSRQQLEELKPYVEGVVASVESLTPWVRKKACPGKPLGPFEHMLKNAKDLGIKRSITIVLGLGETLEEYSYVKDFISKHDLDRITFYSLRPVFGTPYEHGPEPEYVAKWIAKTRIDYPKIEIIAGTAETRIPEIKYLLRAGANAITKIPATKIFGTTGAEKISEEIRIAGRTFTSELVNLKKPEWNEHIARTSLPSEMKENVKKKIVDYEEYTLKKSYGPFKTISACEPCQS